jgi:arsenite methyltransferase
VAVRDTIGVALKRFLYEGFGRDKWQRPDQVIAALGLAPGSVVADLGSGTGYFTLRFARAVGASGRVFAIDTDTSLLGAIARKAAEEGLTNVVPVEATERFEPPAPVDLVFLSNVYHHLTDQQRYFADARSQLADGGGVAILEAQSKGLFARLFGHATDPALIRRTMTDAGYEIVGSHDFLDRRSFQIFRKSNGKSAESPTAQVLPTKA